MRLRLFVLSTWLVLLACACDVDSDVEAYDGVGTSTARPTRTGGGSVRAGGSAGSQNGTGADGGFADSDLNCTTEFDVFDVPMDAPTRQSFAVSVSGNELALAYLVPACGEIVGSATRFGLQTVFLLSTGEISGPTARTGFGGNECFATRDPALLQDQLFYVADSRGFQVQRIELSARTPITTEMTSVIGVQPQALDAVLLGEQTLMFWATTQNASELSDILVFRPNQVSEVATLLSRDEQQRVRELVAAPLDASLGQLRRAAVAWISDSEPAPGLFARVIDEEGQVSTLAVQLASSVGPASSIDLTSRAQGGGAAVYSVLSAQSRYELRFRSIDAQGTFGTEVRIPAGPEDVVDPSLAPLLNGYVVAARVVESGVGVIRLTFLDARGGVIATRTLESAAANASRIRVRAAADGRLFLVWTDTAEAGAMLHARRIFCSTSP